MDSRDALTHQAQSRPKTGRAMTIAVAALIVVVGAVAERRTCSTKAGSSNEASGPRRPIGSLKRALRKEGARSDL